MSSFPLKRGLSTGESSIAKRASTSSAARLIEPKYIEHGKTLRERKKWAKHNPAWIYVLTRQKTSADNPPQFDVLEIYESGLDAQNGI